MDNTNSWLTHYLYAYTLGPVFGGLLAGASYLVLARLMPEKEARNELGSVHLSSEQSSHSQVTQRESDLAYQGPDNALASELETPSGLRCDINDNSM